MTYRVTGPLCRCGMPITPADTIECARCTGLARAVGRRKLSDEERLNSVETWTDFRAWLAEQ